MIEGIREERARLAPIRALADEIVDTTDLTVHELREAFMAISRGRSPRGRLLVTLLSFGFKHGVPVEADLRVRRPLPAEPALRAGTAPADRPRPARSSQFMEAHDGDAARFLAKLDGLPALRRCRTTSAEGKSYLTVAIGCTGGRHRSVMIAEALRRAAGRRRGRRRRLRVRHRDIDMRRTT